VREQRSVRRSSSFVSSLGSFVPSVIKMSDHKNTEKKVSRTLGEAGCAGNGVVGSEATALGLNDSKYQKV
jgi:hypothetical protein